MESWKGLATLEVGARGALIIGCLESLGLTLAVLCFRLILTKLELSFRLKLASFLTLGFTFALTPVGLVWF